MVWYMVHGTVGWFERGCRIVWGNLVTYPKNRKNLEKLARASKISSNKPGRVRVRVRAFRNLTKW